MLLAGASRGHYASVGTRTPFDIWRIGDAESCDDEDSVARASGPSYDRAVNFRLALAKMG